MLFEVGSTTTLRTKPVNGVTHDWTIFVRGYRGADISVIVEKVVFHLHESFPKPMRGESSFEAMPLFCKRVLRSILPYYKF